MKVHGKLRLQKKDCNYKCKFCYAHFKEIKKNIDKEDGFKMIKMLKDYGVYKLNFAGGEPMLNKNLGDYIKFSKSIGLKTSMITNATRLTKKWLNEHGSSIDQIGISCDSLNDDFNKWIGRGFG